MDAILAQLLNGLDKGGAYALIALGLTLVFGTLGVVNFAHGALFMLGAFCAVTFRRLITMETVTTDPTQLSPWGTPLEIHTPLAQTWFGEWGGFLIDYSVPLSILLAIPVMLLIGIAMERGIIRFFYKRSHAEQILVTYGLAIVLQEIIKAIFGPNPISQPMPPALAGAADVGSWIGLGANVVTYPWWRLVYFLFSLGVIAYQMLTGQLPYGAEVARIRPGDSAQRLQYTPATRHDRALPSWIDEALRKAVHPVPEKRYQELSEFVFDLKHPNRAFLDRTRAPLIERDPVAFWRGLSLLLLFLLLLVLGHHTAFG